jgi:hypothetical protein
VKVHLVHGTYELFRCFYGAPQAKAPTAERAAGALGRFEAHDAMATAAARFANDPQVQQVVLASPDKDLLQVRSRGPCGTCPTTPSGSVRLNGMPQIDTDGARKACGRVMESKYEIFSRERERERERGHT